ncbi:hypothetical protein MNBD_NITROSPIRAE01-85 [hydrothermal vent metagenome]|uniref:Uncharacterized protein n=1 Tax=hydrothermal vent metagenome TaxID=652676 RepID=A0A3B1DDV6_9ZZZZ
MIRRKKKEGGFFFIALLALSAGVIFLIYHTQGQAKEDENTQLTSFYEKFVVNEAFMAQLPKDYPEDATRAIREEVSDFYKAVWGDKVRKTTLYEVSGKMETMMADQRIEAQELHALLTLIRKRREM